MQHQRDEQEKTQFLPAHIQVDSEHTGIYYYTGDPKSQLVCQPFSVHKMGESKGFVEGDFIINSYQSVILDT